MDEAGDLRSFHLGDFPLDSGLVLAGAILTYRLYGKRNGDGSNIILLPSYYTGTSGSHVSMIGAGKQFDPCEYQIIAVDLFGNGIATSPSHAATPEGSAAFPVVSVADNIRAQHALLAVLGIERLKLVYGWSLAGIQSYFWAALYPDMVDAFLPVCSASRCWPQNRMFLEGLKASLVADPAFENGACTKQPAAGLRAFGRSYAGWAFSPAYYRDQLYRTDGHDTLEDLLRFWEDDHLTWHAGDLHACLMTWMTADIASLPGYDGNLSSVLGSIRARCILMPCFEDRYFTVEENRIEASHLHNAKLRPITSAYGHCAGGPGRYTAEMKFIENAIRDLLTQR
jgi:homoserine O-acetyltransferase